MSSLGLVLARLLGTLLVARARRAAAPPVPPLAPSSANPAPRHRLRPRTGCGTDGRPRRPGGRVVGRAVGEMVRVVRPGGRVAVLEPDWEMLAVSGNRGLARTVRRFFIEVANAQGTLGRELRALLVRAGCRDVTFEPAGFTSGSLAVVDTLLHLRDYLDAAVAQGWVSAADARAWWDEAEQQDRAGTFCAALYGMIAAGTVP